MQRTTKSFLLVALLFAALVGCKYLPAKTIENPTAGTPEFLVMKGLEAASNADIEAGWEIIHPFLHSYVTGLSTSENNFLNLNFKTLRNKVQYFTKDEKGAAYCSTGFCYKLDYIKEEKPDQEIQVFIKNSKSDMPSPFRIARDPKANNEWRIKNIP